MKTGIIEIRFKEDMSEQNIQDFTSNLYTNNTDKILGMEYIEFDSKETLVDIHKTIRNRIKELDKKDATADN